MPFLRDSYMCLEPDCEWIGADSERCEKCGSAALSLLSVWINRPMPQEPAKWPLKGNLYAGSAR